MSVTFKTFLTEDARDLLIERGQIDTARVVPICMRVAGAAGEWLKENFPEIKAFVYILKTPCPCGSDFMVLWQVETEEQALQLKLWHG